MSQSCTGARRRKPPHKAAAAGADPREHFRTVPSRSAWIATALLMVGLLAERFGRLSAIARWRRFAERQRPTLSVTAQLAPGADPQTMAETVASPLELQFGQIPGLTQMTSASALGYVQITLQFELSRQIDGTVSDTLSAIQSASAYLPKNLPYPPEIRKVNPADTPILVLGITSDSLPLTVVDAYAQNILLEKLSQISGVGLVGIGGEQQLAVRVQSRSAGAGGIAASTLRMCARCSARRTVDLPKGTLNSPRQTFTTFHAQYQRSAVQARTNTLI